MELKFNFAFKLNNRLKLFVLLYFQVYGMAGNANEGKQLALKYVHSRVRLRKI